MNDMVFWAIGNGEKINVWNGNWIQSGIKVDNMRNASTSVHHVEKVVGLVNDKGDWNMN